MVGIIQEQHPDRCRLFMQWKQMGWPILVDAQNLLDLSVVPVTIFIDEHGIVRGQPKSRESRREALEKFLAAEYEAPEAPTPPAPDLDALKKRAAEGGALERRTFGEALVLWGGAGRIDEAIEAFQAAVSADPDDGRAHFRLGVARRMRYDSDSGTPEDFALAVEHWGRALSIDPNQYIWRRRIQQYGPRLAKPYPFYDWVETARLEIAARGETPVTLRIEPGGAELTQPSKSFTELPDVAGEQPDGEGRIQRDPGELMRIAGQSVPAKIGPGESSRIHLEFRPNPEKKAHWNNESRGLLVWVDVPDGWQVDRQRIELDNPSDATSDEARRIEFEVKAPESSTDAMLQAYALYYVCEGANGQCLYRRQDFSIRVPVEPN